MINNNSLLDFYGNCRIYTFQNKTYNYFGQPTKLKVAISNCKKLNGSISSYDEEASNLLKELHENPICKKKEFLRTPIMLIAENNENCFVIVKKRNQGTIKFTKCNIRKLTSYFCRSDRSHLATEATRPTKEKELTYYERKEKEEKSRKQKKKKNENGSGMWIALLSCSLVLLFIAVIVISCLVHVSF